MNEIIFEILKAVLIITILILTRYGIPWIKRHTELAQDEYIASLVKAAVQYAEQVYTDPKSGAEKKAIVTRYLRELLLMKNISISDEQIDILIESAVYAMHKEV